MWSPHHCFLTDLFCTDLPSLGDRCIFYTLDISQYFSFSLSSLPFSLSQFLSRKYSKLHIICPQTRHSGHLNTKAFSWLQKQSSFSVLPEPFFHFLGRSVFTLSQARVRHQFPYLQTGTSHTLISTFLPGPLPRMGLDYSRFPPHFWRKREPTVLQQSSCFSNLLYKVLTLMPFIL